MKEERGWVMRQREKERGRRREWKTSLWWWWDLFRPGSFDVSVTGAPEPGTGSLVKHATTHLPRHHSLPLFPSDSPLPPPSPFRRSSSLSPGSRFRFISIPFLTSHSWRALGDAFQTPSSFSSLLFALLLAVIKIHPYIPLRGVSLGAPFELLIMHYFQRTENFFGTEWKIWWLVFSYVYIGMYTSGTVYVLNNNIFKSSVDLFLEKVQ